jgi:hypothetical protein
MIITTVGAVKSVWNWLLASEGLEGYPKTRCRTNRRGRCDLSYTLGADRSNGTGCVPVRVCKVTHN